MIGRSRFIELMDSFGRQHAGKEVSTEEFIAAAEKATGKPLQSFFETWLTQPGLPALSLGKTEVVRDPKGFSVRGLISTENCPAGTKLDLTVDTDKGETIKTITITGPKTTFDITTAAQPERIWLDKYCWTPQTGGACFHVLSFQHELPETLIVYGTVDEGANNRETAEALQRAIIRAWSNFTVPLKADTEITDEDLRSHHLLLIGRPDSNRLVERFRSALPIDFGARSFTVRNETYAHAGSAVIVAGENPANARYSVLVLAGLSADATLALPAKLFATRAAASILVAGHEDKTQALTVPPRQRMRELKDAGKGG
jgi:hypothetical protein